MKFLLLSLFLFIQFFESTIHAVEGYTRSPFVSPEVWEQLTPYFLPVNHPIKQKLDKIFGKKRITSNCHTLANAGFIKPKQGRHTGVIVTKHKKLKGYVIKLLSDENPDMAEWVNMVLRIKGAKIIQDAIDKHGYQYLFKVPKKWIYPLPAEPSPPENHYRKNFILIAEDMRVYKKPNNLMHWKESMTGKKLKAIYTLITELGLDDSIYPWNIPFSKDGKMAFVDTERFYRWPVPYDRTLIYLSKSMHNFWIRLVETNGAAER